VSAEDVVALVVARLPGVTAEQLRAPGRGDAEVNFARQVAMCLCREVAGLSLPQVGARFGRHHSTALHAVRKIRGLAAEPGPVRDLLAELAAELAGQAGRRRAGAA
jgi:chromosomal replication initiator protein